MSPRPSAQGYPDPNCHLGSWEPAFNDHNSTNNPWPGCDTNQPISWPTDLKFTAIHMSLIPKGAHQGHVLIRDAFGYSGPPAGPPVQTRGIRYMILDPATQTFWKHIQCLAPGKGDLFCAGHAWNANGDLLIAGGTGCWGGSTGCTANFEGSKMCYVWTPPTGTGGAGTWTACPTDLDNPMWYPTVLALDSHSTGEDRMLVLGGTNLGAILNVYQCWRPTGGGGSWEPGTTGNTWSGDTAPDWRLTDYPRMHLLSTGHAVTAGMFRGSNRVHHYAAPGVWPAATRWQMSAIHRYYGTSVLFPISPGGALKDWVLAIGGQDGNSNILNSVEDLPGDGRPAEQSASGPQPGSPYPVVVQVHPYEGANYPAAFQGRVTLLRILPRGVASYGQGCAGTLEAAPRLGMRDYGAQGIGLSVAGAPAGAPALLLLGLSPLRWGSVPLPLPLDGLGFPGCKLLTSVEAALVTMTGTAGTARGFARIDVPWPLATSLAIALHGQWLVLGQGKTAPGGLTWAMAWGH